jgi:FKBP-type peptidyl-prolyl cis-trans isomerase
MNTPSRRLLQACSLMTLCAAPLLVSAQTPAAPPAAPAAAQPANNPFAAAAARAAAAAPAPATAPAPVPAPTPLTEEQAGNYFGINFGNQLHQLGFGDQQLDSIVRGIKAGLAGKKVELADQRSLQAYVKSTSEAMTQRNLQAGKDFLAKNGQEKGVVTTASGLQYKILVPGDKKAASPAASDQVTVQYRGTLLDGTEFDSSYSRSQPAEFQVDHVIKGWTEALQLMKPGAKWTLWIPADLAYGERPRPGIPGGSLLTFEVELLSFKSPPPPPPPPPRTGAASGLGGTSLGLPASPPGSNPPPVATPVPPPAAK